jgi:hypothetical protein
MELPAAITKVATINAATPRITRFIANSSN